MQIPSNLTSLDFADRKKALREFLQGQDTLKDINYDGAVINTLISLLAANSLEDAFYLNMVGNEMFLSSAIRRESVVDLVKPLGYLPRSRRSARATLYIKLVPSITGIQSLQVPAKTKFTTTIDGVQYTYQTISDTFIVPNLAGEFEANLTVVEGASLRHRFEINTPADLDALIIPNYNVDTSSFVVTVMPNASALNGDLHITTDGLTEIDANSTVYFVEEIFGGKYRVFFGDGIIGKKPAVGNVIQVDYLVSTGEASNGASVFSLQSSIPYVQSISVLSTVQAAGGGAETESIESIRFNAPLAFEQQNRAVTSDDYVRIIKKDYPFAKAVSVWGGELNDPPQYGYVYISIAPNAGYAVSSVVKDQIEKDLIRRLSVVSITPKIVDPQYLFVKPTVKIFYNPNKTADKEETLIAKATSAIVEYGATNLTSFTNAFRMSRFGTFVDAIDNSFTSNLSDIAIGIRFVPDSNHVRAYDIRLYNPIVKGSVTSTYFTYGTTPNCSFADDGAGNLQIVAPVGLVRLPIVTNAGSVNYTEGKIQINPARLYSATGEIEIGASVGAEDIVPVRNQIIVIRSEDVDVSVSIDSAIRGYSSRV